MTNLSFALRDSATMLRRDARHSLHNLSMTVSGLLTPTITLLLFVYVFGGAIGAGLGNGAYINYVAPAIIIMTVGSGCATTAVNLVMDMNEGIINRFRTMAISRASVLTGQVLGSLIRTLISIALVIGVALLAGFRPTTSPLAWLAALGLVALFTFALTWMAVVFGLIGKTPAGANSLSLIFQLILPFTSSAFVRPDSMSAGVRWFSEYQPFTPVIDTLRGLLLGTSIDNSAVLAVAWCVVLALVGYLWARAVYNRNSINLLMYLFEDTSNSFHFFE
ncbi:MAG: ABC transporter permease [Chloroflexi bacterium 13_1_20CM_54_36]|nr:MAG: ABC transporter permease [Chloroflexi bacterium 13_1_20CM_54_36]